MMAQHFCAKKILMKETYLPACSPPHRWNCSEFLTLIFCHSLTSLLMLAYHENDHGGISRFIMPCLPLLIEGITELYHAMPTNSEIVPLKLVMHA